MPVPPSGEGGGGLKYTTIGNRPFDAHEAEREHARLTGWTKRSGRGPALETDSLVISANGDLNKEKGKAGRRPAALCIAAACGGLVLTILAIVFGVLAAQSAQPSPPPPPTPPLPPPPPKSPPRPPLPPWIAAFAFAESTGTRFATSATVATAWTGLAWVAAATTHPGTPTAAAPTSPTTAASAAAKAGAASTEPWNTSGLVCQQCDGCGAGGVLRQLA